MKKNPLILLFFTFFTGIVSAQKSDLVIKSNAKGLYLDHSVVARENFWAIGRLYHLHPKSIASFNGLDMSKGLNIGQVIKIPLADTNFNQSVNKGVPVYYIVPGNESLSAVSSRNNNVAVENLRNWNDLPGDQVTAGKKLIVGFLITNEMKDRVVTITPNTRPAIEGKKEEVVAQTEKKEPETKKADPPIAKEEPKKEESKKVEQPEVKKVVRTKSPKEGYFKTGFNDQAKQSPPSNDLTLTSGIFKTASGVTDAKYYMLIDKVEPGTIVKVMNPSNNKTIYAKVLYGMEGIRQNQGYDIRISNAAADALDISDQDKFVVKVNY